MAFFVYLYILLRFLNNLSSSIILKCSGSDDNDSETSTTEFDPSTDNSDGSDPEHLASKQRILRKTYKNIILEESQLDKNKFEVS